jgi:hypothetical protein
MVGGASRWLDERKIALFEGGGRVEGGYDRTDDRDGRRSWMIFLAAHWA